MNSPESLWDNELLGGNTMLTAHQQSIALKAPCFALSFLVEPDSREAARKQMSGFSDPAIFHRWMSLSWTFDDADAVALLTPGEQQLLGEFNAIYHSIPWEPIASHPFISDAADDELERLIPVASQLLQSLRSRG